MTKILLAHGSGGKLTHQLINELFLKKFANPVLSKLTDAAVVAGSERLAFTTDSYVVKPIFFPGGDIGKLAVCGTINDLAVMGAKPLYISCGLIIEEGLDYAVLEKIINSIAETAKETNVKIVTGDTKVVEKGSADQLFINTTGIGLLDKNTNLSPKNIQVGDKILVNGAIGDHGLAVLSQRQGFEFQSNIKSDCSALHGLIQQILKVSRKVNPVRNISARYAISHGVKFMRDPTRGGLATVLNEIVYNSKFGILLDEEKIPIHEEVKAFSELLGFDPLYIGNEGKVVVIVADEDTNKVLKTMRRHPLGKESTVIGEVIAEPIGKVCLKTLVKGTRLVDMLVGDQLPRIC